MTFGFSAGGAVLLSFLLFLSGCTSKQARNVAGDNPSEVHKQLLHQAADSGVLFLIGDGVLRDIPNRQVDTCREFDDPIWANNLFELLQVFNADPRLYNKIHVIEVARGDAAGTTIDRGTDGLTRLVIQYGKSTLFEKITPMTMPECARQFPSKNLEVTRFAWPSKEQLSATMAAASDRPQLERFNFNHKFLSYLADHSAILRVTQKQLYDASVSGEPALPIILNKLGEEIANNPNQAEVNYWLDEINLYSKQARQLVFFGLASGDAVGVKVDSSGKASRKINNHFDPSYLFVSFREVDGKFEVSRLQELNTCLASLTEAYKSKRNKARNGGRDVAASFEVDEESFLFPGYKCNP